MKICAFTGHRPQGLPFRFNEADNRCIGLKRELREQIIRLIKEEGVTFFITGMAQGVDIYAAEIVLELKSMYPDIKLECAIPFETHSSKWPDEIRKRYWNIVNKCDKKTVLQILHTPDCMQKRNCYMVDHADVILAVWNGRRRSGTGNTINYAVQKKKLIYRINPETMSVEKMIPRIDI